MTYNQEEGTNSMSRKIRALGVAALAVVAVSAVAAQAAQAKNFTAERYTASVEAVSTADVWTAFGGNAECTENSFSGSLSAASPTLTLVPEYSNCHFGTLPYTENSHDCEFVLHAGLPASLDIKCANPGESIEWTLYASKKGQEENRPICRYHWAEQTGLTGLTFTNSSPDVILGGTIGGIYVTQERISKTACPPGEIETDGKYTFQAGGVTISATQAGYRDEIAVS